MQFLGNYLFLFFLIPSFPHSLIPLLPLLFPSSNAIPPLPPRFMSHAQKLVSPEIYPRPDGTVFICGLNDPSVPVPDLRPLLSSPSSPPPQKRKKGGSPLSPSSLNPVPPNLEKSAWLHEVFGAGVSTHIKDGERLISQVFLLYYYKVINYREPFQ